MSLNVILKIACVLSVIAIAINVFAICFEKHYKKKIEKTAKK